MAVDTRDKRGSAIGEASWLEVLPNPDGAAISQGDRQQVAWMYRGIAASSQEFVPGLEFRLTTPRPHWRVTEDSQDTEIRIDSPPSPQWTISE